MSKKVELTPELQEALKDVLSLQPGEEVIISAPFQYPIYVRLKREHSFIVKFTALKEGVVVKSLDYGRPVNYNSNSWTPHTDTDTWEILPDYQKEPEQWEPNVFSSEEFYYYVDEYCDAIKEENLFIDFDLTVAKCGNMSAEKWQAEEIAKRNRANNRISQYVFEHMKGGEERSYSVFCNRLGKFYVSVCFTTPFNVPMPLRVAEMLCDDLNSGRVVL